MRALILSSLLAVTLAACSQDPKEAGFFGGIYNAATGVYDDRQALLEAEAQAAEGRRDRIYERMVRTQDELANLEPEQQALSRKLVLLDQELTIRSRELDQAQISNDEQAQALADLRTQEQKLTERQLAVDMANSNAAEELAELEKENERLADAITSFIDSLGGS